jgi:DNA modification methylase
MSTELFTIHKLDARNLESIIKSQIVDVTVTSPPYFEMKDYGYKEQIGYGQKYDQYLNDLKIVFQSVYNVTKPNGTLWVIIDAFKEEGEVVPLPFDFAHEIKKVGWKLQEIIIWGKDKTVPWAHKGQMRSSFEYVLMFSKSKNYTFHKDRIRDFESLKKWWVKYPERYNPKGKTPEAIWHFNIPTQGSWGNDYIKHFCPLPEELIAQILKLTTDENDVVLDPFSGSGAVLAKADNMNRKFIGSELNPSYIRMFTKYLKKTREKKRKEYEASKRNVIPQNNFEKLILELRALKYARVLYQKLKSKDVLRIYVDISKKEPTKANSIILVSYKFLIAPKRPTKTLEKKIDKLINKAPLSKFGVEPIFTFTDNKKQFLSSINNSSVYVYTYKVTHKFKERFEKKKEGKLAKGDIILSKIMVELDEKDYE